ncbi:MULTISPECIES: DUF5133 domain-containing protein [Streptomyces]|uniref:DUF5133 domain-containing protein n=1 Tax=Streptomyces cacaoi TaxID=1898 RepID=A0A4Y3QZL2_STRCI|nr:MULTISPECIES: DUF5133 domain-containing protein [Streptomyces]NNG88784.1 DUF5133 domain-containing protein [Streptomyces cacaoi]GEB49878.1 hypothetical protein SCA03_24290 [Streptomyces cacaoi]
MIMHPDTLRGLVAQYETLRHYAGDGDEQRRRDLADVTYTLCVSTGTRDVNDALAAARAHIRAHRAPA